MRTQWACAIIGAALAGTARAQEAEVVIGDEQMVGVFIESTPELKPQKKIRFGLQGLLFMPNPYMPAKVCKPEQGEEKEKWCRGRIVPMPGPVVGLGSGARTTITFTGFGANLLRAGEHDEWQLLNLVAIITTSGSNFIVGAGIGRGFCREHCWEGRPAKEYVRRPDNHRLFVNFGACYDGKGPCLYVAWSYRWGRP